MKIRSDLKAAAKKRAKDPKVVEQLQKKTQRMNSLDDLSEYRETLTIFNADGSMETYKV